MPVFFQDNTYDDNTKVIFGQTTGATNFPHIRWFNDTSADYWHFDNSSNGCIWENGNILWMQNAGLNSGFGMQIESGIVKLFNSEGLGNGGTIRLTTTTSGVDINGKFVTTTVSDCAGLNMTDDLDMNSKHLIKLSS